MGLERATRRTVVDRRRGREVQDGKGKNRQSKRDVRGEGQGLGRCFQSSNGRHLGVPHRTVKDSRGPGSGEKARRNFPLEFRLDINLDVGGRPRFRGRFGAEKLKLAPDGTPSAQRDLEGLKAGVPYLSACTVLVVLNNRVVDLQFPFGSYDIISAEAFVKEITEDTEFPIVIRIINQRRFWKDAFQTELVSEQ